MKRHLFVWIGLPLVLAVVGITLVVLNGTHVLLNERPAKPQRMTWTQFNTLKLGEPATVIAKFIPEVSRDRDSSGDTVIPSADGLGYFWLEWDSKPMPGYEGCYDSCPQGDFLHKKAYYPKEGPNGPQGQGTSIPG